ncbi:MAG: leucine-rich repeat domain-containing protein [Anaerolineae bacterium]|nr:leucine-rich repeat domain-containing protein [Anaerolineae bacterium]
MECEALVALYDATGGEGWYENEGWLVSERICSSWWGITCMDGHVTGIELFENNLNGELPHEIGNLSKLQDIDLRFNNLSELPPEIGNLSNLQWLYLPSNKLSELPPEIGNLSNLQSLNLTGNELSDLPPEIGNLSNLQQLYLGTNNLSDLPPEICSLDVSNIGNSSLCP